jgi:hypothetical protein
MRIQKFSRQGIILLATVVIIITSMVVANATQTKQHEVDIQLASASTIRVHNANTNTVAGNVTFIVPSFVFTMKRAKWSKGAGRPLAISESSNSEQRATDRRCLI